MNYDLESLWFYLNHDSFVGINKDDDLNFKFDFTLNDCKVMYNNDGTFKRLRISDEIFVSIYDKKFKDKLKCMIGLKYTIIENGHKIWVGPEFPGEFLYSKSTLSLSKKEKFIKMHILNYLDQMLLYSTKKT